MVIGACFPKVLLGNFMTLLGNAMFLSDSNMIFGSGMCAQFGT